MTDPDLRPPVWVGHITLATPSLADTHAFMVKLGMRSIVLEEGVGVLELRGGTHLVLLRSDDVKPGSAGFDLMVDDLDATHERLAGLGLEPSAIARGEFHDSFTVTEPGRHVVKFNSTHVSDLPV